MVLPTWSLQACKNIFKTPVTFTKPWKNSFFINLCQSEFISRNSLYWRCTSFCWKQDWMEKSQVHLARIHPPVVGPPNGSPSPPRRRELLLKATTTTLEVTSMPTTTPTPPRTMSLLQPQAPGVVTDFFHVIFFHSRVKCKEILYAARFSRLTMERVSISVWKLEYLQKPLNFCCNGDSDRTWQIPARKATSWKAAEPNGSQKVPQIRCLRKKQTQSQTSLPQIQTQVEVAQDVLRRQREKSR